MSDSHQDESRLQLSILDQVPVRDGGSAAESLQETIALAGLADQLGYTRYWLAEHHSSASLACASPEVLIPQIAANTSHIRVGSGGVMLPHYSPLKVAESFRLLESLFPKRIDLGIGRAPGSDQLTAAALAYGRQLGVDYYPEQIQHLIDLLGGEPTNVPPFRHVRATPDGAGEPELWILGSGVDSAVLAGHFGCAYSHAHFINPHSTAQALDLYREHFKPGVLPEPRANVGVSALCAETEAEADRLALSRYLWWIKAQKGELGAFPSVEEAERYDYDKKDRAIQTKMRQRSIAGTGEQVFQRLEGLAIEWGIDEIVVLTITHDPAARRQSYELLASEAGLGDRAYEIHDPAQLTEAVSQAG